MLTRYIVQGMNKLQEEIEDLVESLSETVRESIKGKRDAKAKAEEAAAPAKRRRADSDDGSSDSDDDFFDRTKQRRGGAGKGKAGREAASKAQAAGLVHTAASLCVKLHGQSQERSALKTQIMQVCFCRMAADSVLFVLNPHPHVADQT